LQEISTNFLQNILYKTLFAKKNCIKYLQILYVKKNYLQRNYMSIKIHINNGEKKFFLANFFY